MNPYHIMYNFALKASLVLFNSLYFFLINKWIKFNYYRISQSVSDISPEISHVLLSMEYGKVTHSLIYMYFYMIQFYIVYFSYFLYLDSYSVSRVKLYSFIFIYTYFCNFHCIFWGNSIYLLLMESPWSSVESGGS